MLAMKWVPLFLGLGLLVSCGSKNVPSPEPVNEPLTKLVIPRDQALTGAYMDFGETEDDVQLEAIERFEKLVGKKQSIIASSSYWGEQTFPGQNVRLILRHGSLPLIFWSPWDKPYDQEKIKKEGPDRFNLNAILEGKWDAYIDKWADAAKAVNGPILVSLMNEMNGDWFPWSGWFYGASTSIEPEKFQGPETCKRVWRHVVDRMRARGALNVQWVLHLNNYSQPMEKWNSYAQYYPGPDYVDWLGISIYGKQTNEQPWVNFPPLLEWPYQELCKLDPNKPILIAEWGCGEYPKSGNRAQWITDGFELMRRCPRVRGAVFWHERWQNGDGTYSNLRVNASSESLEAYRKGVADPFWK